MRVKGGVKSRKRHKKILKAVKSYVNARNRLYKVAKESYLHAGQYSFNHRKKRYSQMRSLWILRLNAAIRNHDMSYSQFVARLKDKKINLNRKVLSELAINNQNIFTKIVSYVKTI